MSKAEDYNKAARAIGEEMKKVESTFEVKCPAIEVFMQAADAYINELEDNLMEWKGKYFRTMNLTASASKIIKHASRLLKEAK